MYLNYKDHPEKYWIVDTEADSLHPTRFWCAVAKNIGTEEVIEFDTEGMYGGRFKRFIEASLRSGSFFVGHNIISYDSFHLNRLLGISIPITSLVDSLTLSYLYHPHLPGGHSLEAYGDRFKTPKQAHSDWSRFSPEMLSRCKQDVLINEKAYKGLCERMNRIGFSSKSCEIEHKIRYVIDKQERRGFYFDKHGAETLRTDISNRLESLAGPIRQLFPPILTRQGDYEYKIKRDGEPYASYLRHCEEYDAVRFEGEGDRYSVWSYEDFNIASGQQRIEKLLSLGWVPTEFTPKTDKGGGGNPKVNEDALKAFADSSGIPEISAIADWLVLNTRKSTLTSWLNFTGPDSRIHGRVFTCGAGSRRMRHVQPNSANIPSEANGAFMGKEMRELWTATPGRVLMGYDASGLEMRGFCHYLWPGATESQRKMLSENYILGKPHEINSKALTQALGYPVAYGGGGAKTLLYGLLYGSGDKKLGSILGKSTKDGATVRKTLIKSIPGLERAIQEVQEEFNYNNGLLRTIDNGFVRCPSEHAALNYRIQSLGAILMKQSTILLDEWIERDGLDSWRVSDVHDEGQIDCVNEEAAEAVGKLALTSLEEAGIILGINVPTQGAFKIGQNWHSTH